jgi:hypothetical protein
MFYAPLINQKIDYQFQVLSVQDTDSKVLTICEM